MIRLLKFLFTGSWHEHIYEPVEQFKCNTWSDDRSSRPVAITHTYVSRCTCGKIVSRQVEI